MISEIARKVREAANGGIKAGLYDLAWGSMQIPELPDEIGRE